MKHLLLLTFLLASLAVNAQTTDSVQQILNQIIQHAETASLYRNRVRWEPLRVRVQELAKNAKTVSELAPALKHLLEALGDEHGRIYHQNQMLAYYFGDPKPHQKTFNPQIFGQVQSGQVYPFEGKLLNQNIGYVRIVGLPMGDNQQMSKVIEDEVCRLIGQGADRWIIDLRYNGGGNLMPMAEGLAAVIGNAAVGGSEGLSSAQNDVWQIKDGDFYYNDYTVQLENHCKLKKAPKVAVLTSVYTVSSGEALAVMFKGRKQTRFFGEKTGGMITVTDWTVLDPLTAMTISVSYYKDRNGNVYREYVDVDEEVPFVVTPLSEADLCVNRAIEWLKKK